VEKDILGAFIREGKKREGFWRENSALGPGRDLCLGLTQ
jgi:hypothetical protein